MFSVDMEVSDQISRKRVPTKVKRENVVFWISVIYVRLVVLEQYRIHNFEWFESLNLVFLFEFSSGEFYVS